MISPILFSFGLAWATDSLVILYKSYEQTFYVFEENATVILTGIALNLYDALERIVILII